MKKNWRHLEYISKTKYVVSTYLFASYSIWWWCLLEKLSISLLNQRWYASNAAHDALQNVRSGCEGGSEAIRLLERDLFNSGLAGADNLPGNCLEADDSEDLDVSENNLPLRGLDITSSCTVTVTLRGLLRATVVCWGSLLIGLRLKSIPAAPTKTRST